MEGFSTEIRQTERSGVPVLWAEVPGACVGALLVRSGKADETPRTSGVNHLVEHLALFPLGRRPYDYNGRVEDVTTLFWAEGEPDEIAAFLREVAGNIAALPVDRLDVERRILLTEAHGRDPGVEARMLAYRFGARTYGMDVQEELGLGWLDAERVQRWADERFTTGNAVAWMSAEPPEDLELPLARGDGRPAPAPATLPDLELPAEIVAGTGGVAITALAQRSVAVNMAFGIAAERAHERLRRDAGLSYSVSGSYLPLDAETVHLMLGADCKDHSGGSVRDELIGILDDLASNGPTQEELERDLEWARRARAEPTAALGLLDYNARQVLVGREMHTGEELDRERRAVTVEDARAEVAATMDGLLVLVPVGTERDTERFAVYRASRTPPVDGERYGPTELRRSAGDTDVLVVGPEGVTSSDAEGDPLTVRFADCVAFVPLLSGAATVMDHTGAWILVSPHLYEHGDEALERVREALPEHVVVPFTDRERELAPVVSEQLGGEVARVATEVDALASVVTPDEQIAVLAAASWDGDDGLVVLTDRRLVFYVMSTDKFVEFPRSEVVAEVKGRFRRKRLIVAAGGARHELTTVHPAAQLDRLATELR